MALKYQNVTNPMSASINIRKKLINQLQCKFGVKDNLSKKNSIELAEMFYELTKDVNDSPFREKFTDPKSRLIYAKDVCGKINWQKNNKRIVTEAERRVRRGIYRSYLQSPEWKKKREEVFAQKGKKCDHCGSTTDLHVHHTSYKTFMRESLKHLQVLCAPCHSAEHKRLNGANKKKIKRQRQKVKDKKFLKKFKTKRKNEEFQKYFI